MMHSLTLIQFHGEVDMETGTNGELRRDTKDKVWTWRHDEWIAVVDGTTFEQLTSDHEGFKGIIIFDFDGDEPTEYGDSLADAYDRAMEIL